MAPGPIPCHVPFADNADKIVPRERADKARVTARLGEYIQTWSGHLVILASRLLLRRRRTGGCSESAKTSSKKRD
jgi:hypothetical protein